MVNNINNSHLSNLYKSLLDGQEATEANKTVKLQDNLSTGTNVASNNLSSDNNQELQLTARAKFLSDITNSIHNSNPVDSDKVAYFKEKIATGQLDILNAIPNRLKSAENIASKILNINLEQK